jgi:hypothetical protein
MSFYDAKDVYFMSTSATEVKWVEKEWYVYNKDTQKVKIRPNQPVALQLPFQSYDTHAEVAVG